VLTTAGSVAVTAIDIASYDGVLWDLTVGGAHTFFVGDHELLVHNCPRPATVQVHGGATTVGQALSDAERWLGSGYTEIAPGMFRSADGTRQFRMTDSDIAGANPHVHFESIGADGGWIMENSHVDLTDAP
jgi:hypothetical protein